MVALAGSKTSSLIATGAEPMVAMSGGFSMAFIGAGVITPGYHLHKAHWNTIELDGSVPADLLRQLIDHAYEVVHASSRKAQRRRKRPRARTAAR